MRDNSCNNCNRVLANLEDVISARDKLQARVADLQADQNDLKSKLAKKDTELDQLRKKLSAENQALTIERDYMREQYVKDGYTMDSLREEVAALRAVINRTGIKEAVE